MWGAVLAAGGLGGFAMEIQQLPDDGPAIPYGRRAKDSQRADWSRLACPFDDVQKFVEFFAGWSLAG
jgi:hypothetical protein